MGSVSFFRRSILLLCIQMMIAAIGIDRQVYKKLRPRLWCSTTSDIRNVANGQYAEEMIDDTET